MLLMVNLYPSVWPKNECETGSTTDILGQIFGRNKKGPFPKIFAFDLPLTMLSIMNSSNSAKSGGELVKLFDSDFDDSLRTGKWV